MSSTDGFTSFLLSMGSLENEARNDPQGTLFKVLHFCEGLKKSVIGLESTVVELRKENALLRAQVDRLNTDLVERVETAVARKTCTLQDRLTAIEQDASAAASRLKETVTIKEVSESILSSQKELRSSMELAVADRLAEFPTKTAVMMIRTDVEDLEKRFGQVAERLREWSIYRKLQRATEMGICADDSDDTVPADPRNPFSLLHLLHPSKSRPLFWPISRFSTFMRLAKENPYRRLYSQPFGIEKDGTVRCVLRTVVVLLPKSEGDVIQFALEVLFATKYKRKFDFCFQVLGGKPIVKTFSSTEAVVPRYWFPQNELQPSGLITFAFGVDETQLRRDELLVDDKLIIQVGLRA
ncbi:uncharacterized protein LOC111267153 [Varroa jacobsoni]|uniref:uncharacterized protein LOC111267153 n=1 Tax=Varroa jacobsoni TaxID=62625 RepID=UPI000BF9ECBD|nr:uncharacterized protein LOC111267153 [Varroa jacobsoni]